MVLPPLTFMVDPIMNLMSEPYHEYERRSTILYILRVLKNYSFKYNHRIIRRNYNRYISN